MHNTIIFAADTRLCLKTDMMGDEEFSGDSRTFSEVENFKAGLPYEVDVVDERANEFDVQFPDGSMATILREVVVVS